MVGSTSKEVGVAINGSSACFVAVDVFSIFVCGIFDRLWECVVSGKMQYRGAKT